MRLKGGADLIILPGGKERDGGFSEAVVSHANRIAEFDEPSDPLVATLVIGLYEKGTASVGWRCDNRRIPVPLSLLPAWIGEIVRRDIIVEGEAREIFDSMFQWRE